MLHRRYSIHFLFHSFLLPSYLLLAYLFLYFISPQPSVPPEIQNPFSLTVYLPLSYRSLRSLNILLEPFTSTAAPHIHQLVFLSPDHLFADFRFLLAQLTDQESLYHPGIHLNYILKSIPAGNHLHNEILIQASEATTDWVLILDENGIDDVSELALQALRQDSFVTPTSPDLYGFLPPSYTNESTRQDYWTDPKPPVLLQTATLAANIPPRNLIIFLFPNVEVLYSANAMICGFLAQSYIPRVLIYNPSHLLSSTSWQTLTVTLTSCQKKLTIHQTVPSGQLSFISWLPKSFQLLFSVSKDKLLLEGLFSALQSNNKTRIYIPTSEYQYTDWIGSLSISQLQHWHTPEITLSIITQNRPHSLQRLLHSLSPCTSFYFGDTHNIQIRINVDHPSDAETKRLVQQSFTSCWPYKSSVQIHQRIVHGGLLPAIVESWYPNSNESYGLLLEDDVEVSPFFYAWIKMTILKYRYPSNTSPNLYGISLYQQKHLELPLSGRRPFNPRTLFSSTSSTSATSDNKMNPIPINTPYLSSIPCSWGAIYFPEHWREFHEYLSLRNVSSSSSSELVIVPNVRSTKWTRSWKKYFIELVYLKGYVMLYPNYVDFISLSTNHLEFGSHVRNKVSEEKRELFLLPLLQLPTPLTTPSLSSSSKEVVAEYGVYTGLLDLPEERLPSFSDLPVLNLTGSLTTLDSLVKIGRQRERELFGMV